MLLFFQIFQFSESMSWNTEASKAHFGVRILVGEDFSTFNAWATQYREAESTSWCEIALKSDLITGPVANPPTLE